MTITIGAFLFSCRNKTKNCVVLDRVENLINQYPDSAMNIMASIDMESLGDNEERARYALLMSMALDKNFIDTTSFDVLKPAIEYYLEHGSVDNKLRTLYYQGRIFQNGSDYINAMQCFLRAEELNDRFTDTLTYANMLVAKGKIYAQSYQMENYVDENLAAAKLYGRIGTKNRQLSSLVRALDGSIGLGDKDKADSIMSLADSIVLEIPGMQKFLVYVKMTYGISFGSDSVIRASLDSLSNIGQCDDETKLDVVLGYLKLKEPNKAYTVLESIDTIVTPSTYLRYLTIKPIVMEANQEYFKALLAYKDFHNAIEAENSKIYSLKTKAARDIHDLKLNHLQNIQHKKNQLWLGICIMLVLIIIIGIVCYQYRLVKAKRQLSEKEKSQIQLENENLQKKNSVLELEKHAAKLELEKQTLAMENMEFKIAQLETEGDRLSELLRENELPKPIFASIQERIGMLNGLLAAHISDNENYSKPYEKWINKVTEDRKNFMDSTRLAFRVSHPAFMKYLEEHGLNEAELNYVCMYAIGLRGKEIGEYIQVKRHYHTSSDVRKKLGLKEEDTNLGLHIRNLMKKL